MASKTQYRYEIVDREVMGFMDIRVTVIAKSTKTYDSLDGARKAARARLIKDKITGWQYSGRGAYIYRGNSIYESLHLVRTKPNLVKSDKGVEINPDGSKDVMYLGRGYYGRR